MHSSQIANNVCSNKTSNEFYILLLFNFILCAYVFVSKSLTFIALLYLPNDLKKRSKFKLYLRKFVILALASISNFNRRLVSQVLFSENLEYSICTRRWYQFLNGGQDQKQTLLFLIVCLRFVI